MCFQTQSARYVLVLSLSHTVLLCACGTTIALH
uniref:Uncharacterized protein n=1 Tax=Rhizophora mucronata TaxID=61149 RepID=A0A2P2KE33_RHIMU